MSIGSRTPTRTMTEPNFRHLTSALEGGILVLTITEKDVQGEALAGALRQEMLAALQEHPAKNVVVDFRHTEYLSSTAFWPLLSLYRKLQEVGGRVTVCGLSPTVGDVFYTTRLVSTDPAFEAPFGVETDVPAALARLAQPTPAP